MTPTTQRDGAAGAVHPLVDARDLRRLADVLDRIWGARTPLVGVELLRAVGHAGGYVAGAYHDGRLVGGSMGFLARHDGAGALHSHITGVLPEVQGTGLGRALKLHQRAWAAEHGLAWVTWTFDPLVRRNAWFNLAVLGATAARYLVDFYGPIDDAVNRRDESDRLLVVWATAGDSVRPPADAAATVEVPTPADVVALRRTDPGAAAAWRRRLRTELGGRLDAGASVVGFTRAGEYVLRT